MPSVRGHYPMLLLAQIAREPTFGYALRRALAERSGGAFDLPEGTLYPLLQNLAREGYAAVSARAGAAGRATLVYRITPKGRRKLADWTAQWNALAAAVALVVSPPAARPGVGG